MFTPAFCFHCMGPQGLCLINFLYAFPSLTICSLGNPSWNRYLNSPNPSKNRLKNENDHVLHIFLYSAVLVIANQYMAVIYSLEYLIKQRTILTCVDLKSRTDMKCKDWIEIGNEMKSHFLYTPLFLY